jgi:hypothetical protein
MWKTNQSKKGWEHGSSGKALLSKFETLSSNPSTEKRNNIEPQYHKKRSIDFLYVSIEQVECEIKNNTILSEFPQMVQFGINITKYVPMSFFLEPSDSYQNDTPWSQVFGVYSPQMRTFFYTTTINYHHKKINSSFASCPVMAHILDRTAAETMLRAHCILPGNTRFPLAECVILSAVSVLCL